MSTTKTKHYDVIIAGARCAGAATALLLARQGLLPAVAGAGTRPFGPLPSISPMP